MRFQSQRAHTRPILIVFLSFAQSFAKEWCCLLILNLTKSPLFLFKPAILLDTLTKIWRLCRPIRLKNQFSCDQRNILLCFVSFLLQAGAMWHKALPKWFSMIIPLQLQKLPLHVAERFYNGFWFTGLPDHVIDHLRCQLLRYSAC